MSDTIENSLNLLLDTAKKLGAESAAVMGGENTSINVAARLGKLEKSKGRFVCIATIRTSNETKILDTKNRSKRTGGKGNIIIAIIAKTPRGRTPFFTTAIKLTGNDSLDKVFIGASFLRSK